MLELTARLEAVKALFVFTVHEILPVISVIMQDSDERRRVRERLNLAIEQWLDHHTGQGAARDLIDATEKEVRILLEHIFTDLQHDLPRHKRRRKRPPAA